MRDLQMNKKGGRRMTLDECVRVIEPHIDDISPALLGHAIAELMAIAKEQRLAAALGLDVADILAIAKGHRIVAEEGACSTTF